MNKLYTGIGMAALALVMVSACKDKHEDHKAIEQHAAADHAAGKEHTAAHVDEKKVHVKVEGAKVAATTTDSTALYFVVKNDGEADKLIHASAEGVKSVEIHETKMDGNVASMHAVKEVEVAAGKSVTFERGGKHVMLMGLPTGGLKVGSHVKVTIGFEKAGNVMVEAPVVDMPVAHDDHGHDDHKDGHKDSK